MNDNEEKFQTWLEDNAVVHLGNYLYEYKDGEYTLNQLRSIYELEKSIQPAEKHVGHPIDKFIRDKLYFPAEFFED